MSEVQYIPFNTYIFTLRKKLSPQDYYLTLADEAIRATLITEDEFKMYSARFSKMKLNHFLAIGMLENMIKERLRSSDEKAYWNYRNKQASEFSIVDSLLKPFRKNK